MGHKPKLTDNKKREATKRRDHGEEILVEIGRSYNVSGWKRFRGWHEAPQPRSSFKLGYP
jgi:hypothetical protein